MANGVAGRFMDALKAAEAARDAGPVAALFGDDAELSNLTRAEPRRGRDGAHQFWADYLTAFAEIRSEFHAVKEADGWAVLEWTSAGTLPAGCPFHPRCAFGRDRPRCAVERPALRPVGTSGQRSACHYAEELLGGDGRVATARTA